MNIEVINNPTYRISLDGNELEVIKRCLDGFGGNLAYMDRQLVIVLIRTIEESMNGKTNA